MRIEEQEVRHKAVEVVFVEVCDPMLEARHVGAEAFEKSSFQSQERPKSSMDAPFSSVSAVYGDGRRNLRSPSSKARVLSG